MPVVMLSPVMRTNWAWAFMRGIHAMGYAYTIRCDTLIPVNVAVMHLLDCESHAFGKTSYFRMKLAIPHRVKLANPHRLKLAWRNPLLAEQGNAGRSKV